MSQSNDHLRGCASIGIRRVFGTLALCALLLFSLSGCQSEPTQQRSSAGDPADRAWAEIAQERHPSPPDLSWCTRITIHYFPSTREYFFPGYSHSFSQEELDYLETIKVVVIDDAETIKGFAHDVGRSVYDGPASNSLLQSHIAVFDCYRDGEQIADFHIISGLIQTSDGDAFEFKSERTDWRKMRPHVWAMEMRVSCRSKIRYIQSYITHLNDDGTYPAPATWCDGIRKSLVSISRPTEDITKVFKCPGAQKGDCNYAINPNCKHDSPGDTVLLFEARAGWNQHGGPELFTFDNHDPKGGFVILNDGTVKFIRTEEELRQLRWE